LLAGWLDAGNRIGAVVLPGFQRRPAGLSVGNSRRRLQRKLLLRRFVGNADVRLIEFGRPYDWEGLGRQLSEINADVLVCYAFPTLIPQSLLDRFPQGGVNLHPALLPNYRGPHPFHRLAADGQHAVHGGVTLHRMSAGFDDGDILGQVRFSEADWTSKQTLVASSAAAMRMLVSEAAPAYCRGRLHGVPQPKGDFIWARMEPVHTMISSAMPIGHVTLLWHVLGLLPGIYLQMGEHKVRLGFQIKRLGPPTGQAPILRWGAVEFDLADGRVLYLTYNRLLKRLVKVRAMFARTSSPKGRLEMLQYGEAKTANRQDG
jgi:methionyl-tRNA formyltransferase